MILGKIVSYVKKSKESGVVLGVYRKEGLICIPCSSWTSCRKARRTCLLFIRDIVKYSKFYKGSKNGRDKNESESVGDVISAGKKG